MSEIEQVAKDLNVTPEFVDQIETFFGNAPLKELVIYFRDHPQVFEDLMNIYFGDTK